MAYANFVVNCRNAACMSRVVPLPLRGNDEELVKRRARHLKRLLLRNGRSQHDAEDLIQEAFLRLHIHGQGNAPGQQEAFLRRTVLNLSVDLHRRSHRELYVKERPEELPVIDIRPMPDENLALHECLTRADLVLASLSAKTRDAFLLHRLDDWSCAQIAVHFHITVSAVEKHIARAARALVAVMQH